jgi:hypothetical protein
MTQSLFASIKTKPQPVLRRRDGEPYVVTVAVATLKTDIVYAQGERDAQCDDGAQMYLETGCVH